MPKQNDNFFVKFIVFLVIVILAIVTIVYFMEKPVGDGDVDNPQVVNPIGEDEGNEKVDNEEVEEIDNIDEENLNNNGDVGNEAVLDYPNRRYIETHVEMCDDVKFTCEDFEVKFSDETGCGCELTKEYIEEQARLEEERNNQPEPELPPEEEMPEEIGEDNPDEEMTVCTMEYAPVCGLVDGEYQTFGNDCMAEAAGVTEYTEGECAE